MAFSNILFMTRHSSPNLMISCGYTLLRCASCNAACTASAAPGPAVWAFGKYWICRPWHSPFLPRCKTFRKLVLKVCEPAKRFAGLANKCLRFPRSNGVVFRGYSQYMTQNSHIQSVLWQKSRKSWGPNTAVVSI